MFTGIVTAKGSVVSLTPNEFGVRLVIDPGETKAWPAFPVAGDSVSVSGCCLTHAPGKDTSQGLLAFDVIRETLDKTLLGRLKAGGAVNLELSVTPTTALGGHFVQGHVDGVGTVKAVRLSEMEWVVTIEVPQASSALVQYLVPKGSVAVDGVSLTLAAVNPKERTFDVALIPTTLTVTTLGALKAGDAVNLECDTIAKTIVHWLNLQTKKDEGEKLTVQMLKDAGFGG